MNVFWWRPTTDQPGYHGYRLWGDAFYYHHQANALADGKFFINPIRYVFDGVRGRERRSPAALHHLPLALVASGSTASPRTASCSGLLGVATIVVVGLVGRRVAGTAVGLIAATIVAVYPFMWINDGMVMSESLVVLMAALVLWTVVLVRQRRRRHAARGPLRARVRRRARSPAPRWRCCSRCSSSRSRSSPGAWPGGSGSARRGGLRASAVLAMRRRGSCTTCTRFDEPIFTSAPGSGAHSSAAQLRPDLLRQADRLLRRGATPSPYRPTGVDESQRDTCSASTRSTTSSATSRDSRSSSPRASAASGGSSSPGRPPRSTGGSKDAVACPSWISLFCYYAMHPVRGVRTRQDAAAQDHDPSHRASRS